jgi:hypothetical protein
MHSNSRYTDITKLRWVENTYSVDNSISLFQIPRIDADNRIVNLEVEYGTVVPTLQILLPQRFVKNQNLILRFTVANDEPLRLIYITRKNSTQSFSFAELMQLEEGFNYYDETLYFRTTATENTWSVDYTKDIISQKLAQSSPLTLTGGETLSNLYSGDYEIFLTNFNNRPVFFNPEAKSLRYFVNRGWCLCDDDNTEMAVIEDGVGAIYPWGQNYLKDGKLSTIRVEEKNLSKKQNIPIIETITVPASANEFNVKDYFPQNNEQRRLFDLVLEGNSNTQELTIIVESNEDPIKELERTFQVRAASGSRRAVKFVRRTVFAPGSINDTTLITYPSYQFPSTSVDSFVRSFPKQGNPFNLSRLVSGVNIKTINNENILGTGNITISGGEGFAWSSIPNSPTATGTAGQMAYADNYLYVCVAPNTWKRTILATW